jgi:4-amino-4-deoxy-L-arabinose transferase-like glycosyltransferase
MSLPDGIADELPRQEIRSRATRWLRFLLVVLVVFGLRWHTVEQTVVDWDESVYFVVAQDLAAGGILYRTAWDHKGPLLYLPLALTIQLFGSSLVALRLVTTIILVATMFGAEIVAGRLFGSERSFVAPLVYGSFFCVPRFGGLASNAELFMMLPAVVAIAGFVLWRDQGRRSWVLCLSGAAAAAAVLVKPTAAYSVVVVPLLLLVDLLRSRDRSWPLLARAVLPFAAGGLLVVVGTVLVFAARGTLTDFLLANWGFNLRYASAVSSGQGWSRLGPFLLWAVVGDLFTVLAVLSIAVLVLKRRELRTEAATATLLGCLLVTSLLGVSLGRTMYFHYYLQMGLPIALVVAWAVARLQISARDWARVAWVALGLLVVSAFSPHRSVAGSRSRDPEADRVVRQVAGFVREHSSPADGLFVLGGQPVIYFLAERRCPTKFFFWLFHAEAWDASLGSCQHTLEVFRRTPPRWFVYRPQEPRIPALEDFMFAHYRPVMRIADYEIAELATQGEGPGRPGP